MESKIVNALSIKWTAIVLMMAIAGQVQAQDLIGTYIIPLSNPEKAGTLSIRLTDCQVSIQPYPHGLQSNQKEMVTVVIMSSGRFSDTKSWKNGDIPFDYGEKDNVITIASKGEDTRGLSVEVLIPPDYDLKINNSHSDIVIGQVKGKFDLSTEDGNVILTGVKGTLNASTKSGLIIASITDLNRDYPSAISSVSGNIKLSLAKIQSGQIVLSTTKGKITGNLPTKGEKPNKQTAVIGDGIPTMTVTTYYGNVELNQ